MSTITEVPENYTDKNTDGSEEIYYPLSKMENLKIALGILGSQVILGLLVYIIVV